MWTKFPQLPQFSEVDRVREQPTFSDESDAAKLEPPQTMKITHVSALLFVRVASCADADRSPKTRYLLTFSISWLIRLALLR